MIKIGIIGSTNVFKKTDIKELLYKIKETFGPLAIIYSGGNLQGVELDVKECALNFGMVYREFNPSFSGKNEYSCMGGGYYGKPYHFSHFYDRYKHLVWEVDKLFVYTDAHNKKFHNDIIKKATKKGIGVAVIE